MSRRNAELFLLIAATFPVVLLYAMYMSTIGHDITFQTLAVPLGLFAAFTAAHIAVRIFAPGADPATRVWASRSSRAWTPTSP